MQAYIRKGFVGPFSRFWMLKVSKFQNESIKSSHCPKYERKIWKFLPWILRAEFFKFFRSYFGQCDDFIFSFWNLLTFRTSPQGLISSFSLNSFLFYLNWNLSRIHGSRKVIWYDWLSTQCLSFSRATLSIMIMSLAGSFLAVLQNRDLQGVLTQNTRNKSLRSFKS